MKITVVDHPVVAAKLSTLRDESTPAPVFRRLVDDLVTLLAYEATRSVSVEPMPITTPLAVTEGVRLTMPPPLVVPVLRAGVGMLDGMVRLLPAAEVGFAGLVRDERTAQASWYADRLPEDAAGRDVFVLDPMLATGGTLVAVVEVLLARGARTVTCVCLLAAPEGVDRVETAFPDDTVRLVVAAVDDRLDERSYIVPGLGDAGDRLFGSAPSTSG
ncbi:MAG TPA: uracil phosphoribosyltransferase [Mycobacteriales bacterium]|nr:uracil phosphoribosyltransferase [Mycobacteriales bacterium]